MASLADVLVGREDGVGCGWTFGERMRDRKIVGPFHDVNNPNDCVSGLEAIAYGTDRGDRTRRMIDG
jgi:hypothetical protein